MISSRAKSALSGASMPLRMDVPENDARIALQQQKCRSQRGGARTANETQPASDLEAVAGSVQREDSDVIAEGVVELISAAQLRRMDSGSHGPEAVHRVYSSELLLAHRALSLRIARGAPGLEPDPAALVRVGAGLQAVALPQRVQ